MIIDNCTECLYAEESPSLLKDGEIWYKCAHENSPFYNNLVFDTQTCRLFVDYENYIKIKDRKSAIDKFLNNKL